MALGQDVVEKILPVPRQHLKMEERVSFINSFRDKYKTHYLKDCCVRAFLTVQIDKRVAGVNFTPMCV